MKTLKLVFSAALLITSNTIWAQNSGNGGAAYNGLGANKMSPAEAVSKFVSVANDQAGADSALLAVMGLQGEAEREMTETKNLASSTTRGALEKVLKAQMDSMEALEQRLNANKTAVNESTKQQFADGMRQFVKSVKASADLSTELGQQKENFRSQGGSAAAAFFLAKSLPQHIKNVAHTLKAAVAFSQVNNIPFPSEASELAALP